MNMKPLSYRNEDTTCLYCERSLYKHPAPAEISAWPSRFCVGYITVIQSEVYGLLITERENHKYLLMLCCFPFCAENIPWCMLNEVQFSSLSLTACFSQEVCLLMVIFCIGFLCLVVKVEKPLDFKGLSSNDFFFLVWKCVMCKKVQKSYRLIVNRFFWSKKAFWLECLRK